uniref:Uncharacterized protein n=1 Tax=Anguilla anguilla TaxID=7936 RepID=A0A0E9WFV6_ANGAN
MSGISPATILSDKSYVFYGQPTLMLNLLSEGTTSDHVLGTHILGVTFLYLYFCSVFF